MGRSTALGKIDDLASSIASFSETYARFTQVVKALSALRTSIGNNQYFIPHDGQRYHQGEAIATGFVASTVHEAASSPASPCSPRSPLSQPERLSYR